MIKKLIKYILFYILMDIVSSIIAIKLFVNFDGLLDLIFATLQHTVITFKDAHIKRLLLNNIEDHAPTKKLVVEPRLSIVVVSLSREFKVRKS